MLRRELTFSQHVLDPLQLAGDLHQDVVHVLHPLLYKSTQHHELLLKKICWWRHFITSVKQIIFHGPGHIVKTKYVDDDILRTKYIPRAHTEQRQELETGLIAAGANSSLVVGQRGQQTSGPQKLLWRGPPNQIKDHHSLLAHTCARSFYKMSLIREAWKLFCFLNSQM